MASALISGVTQFISNDEIIVSSPGKDDLDLLRKNFGISTTTSNVDVIKKSKFVFLAIKPNILGVVLDEIRSHINIDTVLISIVAGANLNSIENKTPESSKVIRAMPNTPVSIGKGITALCANSNTSNSEKEFVDNMFSSVGSCIWLSEGSFDLYTSVFGSGPAYVFYLSEILIEATEDLDIEPEERQSLIAELIKGASSLILENMEHPASLRGKVTSPGGVTEKAIQILDKKEVKESFLEALHEATKKSKELGR